MWLRGLYGWLTVGEGGCRGGMAGIRDAPTEATGFLSACGVGPEGPVATGHVSEQVGSGIRVRCGVSGPGGVNTGVVGTRGRCGAASSAGFTYGALAVVPRGACAIISEGEAGSVTTGRRPSGGGVISHVMGATGVRGACSVGPGDAGGIPEVGGLASRLCEMLAGGAPACRCMGTGGGRAKAADTVGACGPSPMGSDSVGGTPEVGGPVDPLGAALADGAPASRCTSTGGIARVSFKPKDLLGAVRAGPEGMGDTPEGSGLGTPLDNGLAGTGAPRDGAVTVVARLARAGPPSQALGSWCGGDAGVVDGTAPRRVWVAVVLTGAASSGGPYTALRATRAAR